MAKVPHGIYRTPGWAYVTDGTMGFDVPEGNYRSRGYKPPYERLPSKNDYDAAEAAKKVAEEAARAKKDE